MSFSLVLCDLANIQENNLNEAMKDQVITAARAYLEYEKNMTILAEKLCGLMDEKYGNSWECMIGDNVILSGKSNHETWNFIWFTYMGHHFVVFKTNSTCVVENVNINCLELRYH